LLAGEQEQYKCPRSQIATERQTMGQAKGGEPTSNLSREVLEFVKANALLVALAHVRIIDGTGAPAREDQTILIRQQKITFVGDSASVALPEDAFVLDLCGHSVIPGLVGMHDHLFYTGCPNRDGQGRVVPPGPLVNQISYSAPRLYLACGVTTIRTTGSIEPYTDLNVKKQIDEGRMPGPKIDVTGPFLTGAGPFPQMHQLTGPKDARRMVAYWTGEGVTSFKTYMHITRAELAVVIEEAHKRSLKVTGHLGSVGYREAAALGIDNLEHGPIYTDSEFVPEKQPDVCPPPTSVLEFWSKAEISSVPVQEMIHDLVSRNVAITSTLPVFELGVPGRPTLQQRVLDAMCVESRDSYLTLRARGVFMGIAPPGPWELLFKREMEFERAFVKAGGLLLAGPDPTGMGGVLPGFGDQREVELLVEAGFTPLEAIQIATLNGARFLGRQDRIGSIEQGKQADMVVVRGDPSRKIEDMENVEIVFKDGIAYDPAMLIESVRGQVGIR
jgi:imidazolonepropionase-like amidohydrolase